MNNIDWYHPMWIIIKINDLWSLWRFKHLTKCFKTDFRLMADSITHSPPVSIKWDPKRSKESTPNLFFPNYSLLVTQKIKLPWILIKGFSKLPKKQCAKETKMCRKFCLRTKSSPMLLRLNLNLWKFMLALSILT